MRRSSRVYLRQLNKGKSESIVSFLDNYALALNYAIVRTWSDTENRMSSSLASKAFTDSIRTKFGVTARLSQCISKQAKEICLSQKEKDKRERMPRMTKHVANLDSRLVAISNFTGCFDLCLKFGSGVPKLVVPFNRTKHMNKFLDKGWLFSKSVRLGYDDNRELFVDIMLEKEKPALRTTGKVVGLDRGLNCMLATSDGQFIGKELKEKIKAGGKRRKTWHHFIETEALRYLKQLNLTNVKTLVMENLKYVKNNKRGKFSRNVNRLLSFWLYAKVGKRLQQLCEELGIRIALKNPWKTSQRCYACGNIDRRNRSGEKFLCLKCGNADNADHNASKNLELLGLAGVYSLRSLKN